MDTDELRKAADAAADADGNVEVTAVIDGVMDNGKRYRAGETFAMEKSLVAAHAAGGQVTVNPASKAPQTPRDKQQPTPRDKQQRGGADK